MTTPKHRATERQSHLTCKNGRRVEIKPLKLEGRTYRQLLDDPRVQNITLDVDGRAAIRLKDGWVFSKESVLSGPDANPDCTRSFDLWEQARNAVRRAIGPDGKVGIRHLRAQ